MPTQEKMIRLQTLWDILNKHKVPNTYEAQLDIQEKSLNAAPVVHAWWRGIQTKIPVIVCSNCWGEVEAKHKMFFHYCPFCGARMDLKGRK